MGNDAGPYIPHITSNKDFASRIQNSLLLISSTICRENGIEHVQPGETVFRTCIDFLFPSSTKSISSLRAFMSTSCARMPGFDQCLKLASVTPCANEEASDTIRRREY